MTIALDIDTQTIDAGEPVWVVTRPRNDASGLVPRVTQTVPAWDYAAAARRLEAGCDPELVAAAKANPTDRTAGFRAYGVCY
ncbi:hypothetical protein NOVA_33115 [Nocardia nova]|uniref:hypothetical protein n=1 Tax=Nocardia nova TaxID=37330 RepID=UPI001C473AA1|nr:hypothetical protein [Nocardia nova]MBV7707635.1 hypothetical protein [Nocardia nova]